MILTEETFQKRNHSPKYVLHFWGSIENTDAVMPLGTKGSHYWCDTLQEIESLKSEIQKIANNTQTQLGEACVVFSVYGEDENDGPVDRKSVAVVCFEHKGKQYKIEYDFGYGYPYPSAEIMFSCGNYACDCNRSDFIQMIDESFPSLDCGHEIEMTSFDVEYR